MLEVKGIFAKRGNSVVLRNITFNVEAGKTLVIVGESGAGKSTLIACILGLLKLSKGQIHWAGNAIRHCQPALVMQEPRAAFNPALSLRHSVMEPVSRKDKKSEPIELNERITRLCKGLEIDEELLDRRPHEVSIGQAQRAGILRALIASPPFVLFDEPLSALDAVTQKHTAKLIADLQQEEGFASLIVTHDLGYAIAYADQIIVLKSGQIEERATPETFLQTPQSDYCKNLKAAAIALGALEEQA